MLKLTLLNLKIFMTNQNVKIFVRKLLKKFSKKQGNIGILNDFLRKIWNDLFKIMHCSKQSAVLFLCHF